MGQISLNSVLPKPKFNSDNPVINLTIGKKLLIYDPGDESVLYIANFDGTIYSTISIDLSNYELFYFNNSYPSFSDNLFDMDSGIEYLATKPSGGFGYDSLFVFNEDGTILFKFPFEVGGKKIINNNNNYYLLLDDNTNQVVKTYSLPGTLPCDPCSGLSGLVEPNTGGIGEMKLYPNPFNNTLQVNYDFLANQSNPRLVLTDILGRELKEIKLTSQTDNVSINTSDLPKGTIIVSLYGGQNMISKKVIKID
jgi:hypothetical protein